MDNIVLIVDNNTVQFVATMFFKVHFFKLMHATLNYIIHFNENMHSPIHPYSTDYIIFGSLKIHFKIFIATKKLYTVEMLRLNIQLYT